MSSKSKEMKGAGKRKFCESNSKKNYKVIFRMKKGIWRGLLDVTTMVSYVRVGMVGRESERCTENWERQREKENRLKINI